MLFLLREIREKLLSEFKFSKHLKYAIGEIVLAVIEMRVGKPII